MVELRQRQPREEAPKHLAFIQMLPCLACGQEGQIEAAHVRYGSPSHGKRPTGAGEKPSDCWTVPLCVYCHRDQHAHGERDWWLAKGIDPLDVAALLWLHSGNENNATSVIIFNA